MFPLAHIVGIPIEETLGVFAPVSTLVLGAAGVSLRSRLDRMRRARRMRGGEGDGGKR